MSIPSSEVISQTIRVLEDVCLLLDDEIVERTGDHGTRDDVAAKCTGALNSVRGSILALRSAQTALAASERVQSPQHELLGDGAVDFSR